MKYRLSLVILLVLITLYAGCASVPSTGRSIASISSKKGSIALFPLTGGSIEDGETIISRLGRQGVMNDAFEKITVLTRSNISALDFERGFQLYSGLTDPDSIFQIGRDLNAAYVIAGYLTKLGNRNLIILSIMEVDSLRQIAGEYRIYDTLSQVNSMIPELANNLVAAVSRDTDDLPGLSVPPFDFSTDIISQNDAMVLAQILSCELSKSGGFAVLPRTEDIQTVLAELRRQRSGIVNTERLSRLGAGYNADYVLSGKVERLGGINMLAVDVLSVEDGSSYKGHDAVYTNFSQESITLMQEFAAVLTGRMSDEDAGRAADERRRQLDAAAEARRTVEAQRAAEERRTAEAQKAAEARRQEEERKRIERERFWTEKKDIDTGAMGVLGYFQWGDNELKGGGIEIPFRYTPIAFTSLGGEFRLGPVFGENISGGINIGAGLIVGLVWPFTDWFRLYADGMLEFGYFGGVEGLITPLISPSVIVSAVFGSDFLYNFAVQYRHTWHKDKIVQSVSVGYMSIW